MNKIIKYNLKFVLIKYKMIGFNAMLFNINKKNKMNYNKRLII